MVRRITNAAVAVTLLVGLTTGAGPVGEATPADAWCYLAPLSATLDWEWNGSDAHMDWASGDVGFDPRNSWGYAVIDGPKRPTIEHPDNYAIAGWTSRSRGNVEWSDVHSSSHAYYGGLWATSDYFAERLAVDLRPCT